MLVRPSLWCLNLVWMKKSRRIRAKAQTGFLVRSSLSETTISFTTAYDSIFDLMIQYIIDNNKDLLERAVGKDVDLKSLFATIDSRTRKYKDKKMGQIIDEKTEMVNRFNNGGVLVLFGGETPKRASTFKKIVSWCTFGDGLRACCLHAVARKDLEARQPYKYAFRQRLDAKQHRHLYIL